MEQKVTAEQNGKNKKEKCELKRTERLGKEWDGRNSWDQLEVINYKIRGTCSELIGQNWNSRIKGFV